MHFKLSSKVGTHLMKGDNNSFISRYFFKYINIQSNDNNVYKISIVTPSFNQGKYIEETIRSVLSQQYPNLEYIIIDGGSQDQTIDIIKKYELSITYWKSESDNGQTCAINKGLKQATGEIIGYLNSDDLYTEKTLEYIANYFLNHPDIDMIYGDNYIIDGNSTIISHEKVKDYNFEKLFFGNYITQPSVFFRQYILNEIGFFDENLHYSMDYEYWIRI